MDVRSFYNAAAAAARAEKRDQTIKAWVEYVLQLEKKHEDGEIGDEDYIQQVRHVLALITNAK